MKRSNQVVHPKGFESLCSAIQQMPYHLGNGYTRVASLRSEVLRPTAALSFAVAQQLAGHVALPVSTTTAKRFVDWWRIPVKCAVLQGAIPESALLKSNTETRFSKHQL